ncbi:hypothetical protein GLOTRDRAFT_50706 [Gloeophyllum trabeum ATCC 11539]|uniref:Phosphatidate cytidylyltransferase n=1 Tax=Gloeophyllum trabeum (strain ATCC 11539 / FP-39264 / Madison 617) TaxID=670483 RepID=S7R7F5_GLOTA|nr:uncharacterized protein GLOTRDRAFT_50706 [Gloeophyllum trabeum ATCC 11539]EPQ50310.1 hypothetical protein GLOTRDRAFT_50706 [Gloeophyllum trabeum ATCC 11539]
MPHPRKTQRHASGNGTVTRLKDVEEESLSRGRSPEKKKEKVDWEIPRKTLHSSIGFLTLHLYTSDGNPKFVVLALAVALAVLVPLDVLRLRSPTFERLYERCVGFLMRDVEKKTTNGVIWYIIGAIFVLSVYPLDIAVVSILILSWADTAASTIGRLWGRHTPPLPRHLLGLPLAPRKSLAGFLAASLTGGVVAAGFWRWVAPVRAADASWTWEEGVIPAGPHAAWAVRAVEAAREAGVGRVKMAGWAGLAAVGVVAGLVSGVAEALGECGWLRGVLLCSFAS